MRHLTHIFLLCCLWTTIVSAQNSQPIPEQDSSHAIEWLDWTTMVEQQKKAPKRVVMLVYTSWCTWCDRMEKQTLDEAIIANYIDTSLYAVKFDAEFKEEIEYKDKAYRFQRRGKRGYHELVVKLLKGQFAFPTIIFLDSELNAIQSIPGFRPVSEFLPILRYFGDGAYENQPWENFILNWQAEEERRKQELGED